MFSQSKAHISFVFLLFLLGCQSVSVPPGDPEPQPIPSITPQPSPVVDPVLEGYPFEYTQAITQVIDDVATECKSYFEVTGAESVSITCGNIIIIFYPPKIGPSDTTLVPVAHFLYRNARWLINSETEIEVPGMNKPQPLEFLKDALLTPGLQTLMSKSSYLVSVGTASSEGGVARETLRAEERSINIDGILRETLPGDNVWKAFYRLNLGKYENTCVKPGATDTAHQRPVLVMSIIIEQQGQVLSSELAIPGLDENEIETLLQDKVRRTPAGDIDFSCYPKFKLEL
jgi:hypothetical protein